MSKYKYILFDADNTLFDFDMAEEKAFAECCAECGVEYSDELFSRYIEINTGLWRRIEEGTITRDELKYKRFSDLVGEGDTAMAMSQGYVAALGRQSFLFEGAFELCERLSREYSLYIVTNGIASVQHGRIDSSRLSSLLKKLYISEELGFSKPDVRFFDAVISDISDPDRTKYLVIGDSLTSDITGAVASSLDSCWFNPKHLDSKGITPTYTIDKLSDIYGILL